MFFVTTLGAMQTLPVKAGNLDVMRFSCSCSMTLVSCNILFFKSDIPLGHPVGSAAEFDTTFSLKQGFKPAAMSYNDLHYTRMGLVILKVRNLCYVKQLKSSFKCQ